MNPGQTRRWINRRFGNERRNERSTANPPTEEEMVEVLDQLSGLLISGEKEQTALELFLYAGCGRFDRWFAPSPPSVPSHYSEVFRRFAECLAASERLVMNSPVFLVHSVRDALYADFGGVALPITEVQALTLDGHARRLADIPVPEHPTKKSEFQQAKAELSEIIEGLRQNTLRSFLKTSVPYPMLRRPVRFALDWEGRKVFGNLTPEFSAPPSLIIQTAAPTVLVPHGTTRWQYGRTLVEIEIVALIDPSISVAPLQLPSVDLPFDTWPNGLRVAFELLYEASWQLRGRPEFVSVWVPAPGDLGDIESWCATPGLAQINYIRRSHPSMLFEGFVPTVEPSPVIELGSAAVSFWHMKCYVLAEQYASFGETREALFWFNVGVEALLRNRMETQVARTKTEIDLDRLDGADAYWDHAKEIVGAQFPELVDEIEWPRTGQKPSLFRQIKFFCRTVAGAPDLTQAQASYSKVSKKRNALFHGESQSPVTIEDVKRAKDGFDWLLGNFCP
jgi:hypothetical protein